MRLRDWLYEFLLVLRLIVACVLLAVAAEVMAKIIWISWHIMVLG
jgi:hypothetical protein